jgi:hypothetical protein
MKIYRFLIAAVLVLALAFLFIKAWLESLVSERLWTWINNQLWSGANPGLTSDIELLVVSSTALLSSALITYFAFKAWNLKQKP